MAHRPVLTKRQRNELLNIPDDETTMLKHYVLSEEDMTHINRRRGDHNRLGFALQLCVFRYPGRFIQSSEVLPQQFITFIGAQLGISPDEAAIYAERTQTHYEHSASLKRIYRFMSFRDHETECISWLERTAIETRNNAYQRALC